MTINIEKVIFEALADRLGEHPQARNYEIADSGEYETKLRGPIDVEVLAEWLVPTVLATRPEPPVTDAEIDATAEIVRQVTGEPRIGRFERTAARAALEAARVARGGKNHG